MSNRNVRGVVCTSAWIVAFFTTVAVSAGAAAQQLGPAICGDIFGVGFGPFDYRKVSHDNLNMVESAHFTADVQALKKGNGGYLGQDIDYTMRALPNNPRGLLAVRYATKMKSERPPYLKWPAECYFERATRFVPDDPMPHVIWAIYLRDRKRMAEARNQVEQAEALRGDPSNFDLDYNIGLLYFDLGAYDKSLAAATRAYALGAPLPALRSKLKAAGKWQEPPAPAPAAAPSSAAADSPAK